MKARTGVLLAAIFATCGAPQALAAAKPVCLQVVDAAGDATTGGMLPNRASLDILSADVATGPRNLVGVIRLGSVELDPTLVAGVTYEFSWRAGAATQAFSLVQYTDGSRVVTFDPNSDIGASGDEKEAKLTVDTVTKSLVFTVPRKANPALNKRGARFTALTVKADPATNFGFNQNGSSASFHFDNGIRGDDASSVKAYTDLTPSCVKGV